MQAKRFRINHLVSVLKAYEAKPVAFDAHLNFYFRSHKSLGSKDRAFVAENAYQLIRWKGLIDALTPRPLTWEGRVETLLEVSSKLDHPKEHFDLPPHLLCSCPKTLFEILVDQYGQEKAEEIALTNNQRAPTTLRANTLLTTRDELLKKLEVRGLSVSKTERSPVGIQVHQKCNFFTLPEFTEGLFEVQDEASQLVAALVETAPGEHVLDYCSGSGGKTLAFAPAMERSGQIYLHDIRKSAHVQAKKRLHRATIQTAQSLLPGHPQLKRLKKQMDWVLVDAPCTGTGTYRRNPDMKWKFTPEMVDRLVEEQREIFAEALTYLKPTGRIVYATCSLLKQENEQQMDFFQKAHGLTVEKEPFKTLPTPGGMDGFFGVVFYRSRS